MKLEKVPGKLPGSFIYLYGPWKYNEIKGSNETKFNCQSKRSFYKCPAKLIKVNQDYEANLSDHNHPEPPAYEKKIAESKIINQLCEEGQLRANEIMTLIKSR